MKITLWNSTLMLCATALWGFPAVSRAQEQIVIAEDHVWNYLHPMGTVPPRADTTPDPDFDTSWYLAQAQFLTTYDGPGFTTTSIGDPAVLTSADSGSGPGPFAYGGVDGIAVPNTVLTVPASGNRNASYYRTTFTVPAGGLIEPSLRMVCDDGAFIYLDGTLIARVNIADGVADTYTAVAADAANTEVAFIFPLRVAGIAAGASAGDVNVVVPVPALTAGSHTLAVALRNNANTSSDMGMLLELSALPPATTTLHAVVTDVVRDLRGTPVNLDDDEISFKVTLSGNNTGATWSSDNPARTGPYNVAATFGPYSASGQAIVNFTAAANPAVQTTITVDPPTAFKTLVNYNQSWKIMNPLAGVVPPRPAGGEDADFDSTWFLKENNFVTQYDGPNFGADGVAGSYEALTGAGPFAVGGVDGIAAGQPVGAAGTAITLPPSGSRYAGYFRTTFTTTQPMSLVTFDVLCDDGMFIYLDGNLVAQENMNDLTGSYKALATAARGETLITTIDLSQPPGGNVIATVNGLAPGTHTLAMSIHQSAATSSDLGLALKMSGIEVIGQPVIEAVVSDIIRSGAGTPGDPFDDTFTFKVMVAGSNAGSSWTSNSTPASGNYGVSTAFGPFPVSEGIRTVQFAAASSPATATTITVTPPASTLTVSHTAAVRDDKGTPVDSGDDTFSFQVTVNGTFLSNQWNTNVTTPASGSYNTTTAFGPFPAGLPAIVTITDSADTTRTSSFTVYPPRYVPQLEIVPYSQTWQVMNPQGGVVPEGVNGPDEDFDTTWYLPEAAFTAQYNGPTFGVDGVAGVHEAIQGPGPFAVGGIDGLAAGTTVGAAGTATTLPATASRFSSYYRTTFTTAQATDNLKLDVLCDDGVFIYLDGVLVARENMPGADTFDAFASGARNENQITTINLSAEPGVNVVSSLGSLPAGTHTLAVSLHQNAADSSDNGFALTMYGRVSSGVSVSSALGTVTRTLNNTASPADDTFQFPITVNAVNGAAGGWTSNSIPASGSYGVPTVFGPFPASEAPKTIVFTDKSDNLARSTRIVNPPPIFGVTVFNNSVSPVVPSLPLAANWTAHGGVISHSSGTGVVAPGSQLASGAVNLVGITGPVLFQMNLNLSDTSTTTNFEIGDSVLAELVLNDGAGEQRVNLISAFDSNGDGVLNGYTGVDAPDYNLNKALDELNGAGADAEASVNYTFALSGIIPDSVTSAQVVVTAADIGGTETVTVSGVTFTPYSQPVDTDGDGQTDASEALAGTSPADPDDYLRISALTPGAGTATVSFGSKTGRNYQVEASNRVNGGWTALGTVIAGTGAAITVPLPQFPVAGETRYFLRIRVIP
ncbi:MAG: hypothetical protein V4726_16905 [Verrucomicrobiota bacterium]